MNEEFEQLLRSKAEPIVVQITEPFLEADAQTETVAEEIRKLRADAYIVRIDLSLHREWARKHRVFGAPCLLVFSGGQLRIRIRGHVNRTRLRSALARAGLLRSPTG